MKQIQKVRSAEEGVIPARVFLIDDEILMLHEYQELFEISGIPCNVAADPLKALDHIVEDQHIELVITDVRMPGMSGPELIRTLKMKIPSDRKLNFIILSGHEEKLGPEFKDVIQLLKPIDLALLIASINEALGS
jgi:YesN/AraC family two-component response regulator